MIRNKNNFLFGNEDFAYYETVGGGSGAGPGWNGPDPDRTGPPPHLFWKSPKKTVFLK